MKKYIPSEIEPKWQKKWEEDKLNVVPNESEKPKKYILDMFPYPSGEGLHVGHFKLYTSSDVISRFYRLKGFSVLHPMGWDAFGLPAENYAIQNGVHPSVTTAQNVANIKQQMQLVGLSYDWDREINTTDPNYYKWTQWIFLKLFEKGLAYEDEVPINWCPKDKTGLANEEVVAGVCERCGTKVEQKKMRQWILRITKYADRLIEDLEGLEWPEFIKQMQVNWIGRKEGINITYEIDGNLEKVICFTTRPDTNFGATFIVIGPEHPLIEKITKKEYLGEIKKYIKLAVSKTEEDRITEGRKKTGVFTGSYAINNLTGKKMPIWVSDFVLGDVGTGAVVGVPGHDKRDFEFAKEFDLPIIRVVIGKDKDTSAITRIEQVQEDEGKMVNSQFLDGMDIHQATIKIMDYLEEKGWGVRVVTYHLRDWIFSRQRYWGEPIPLIHCPKCGTVAIPEDQLPLKLPEVEKYEPTGTGESPLANIPEWVNTSCPKCGGKAKRETNTMPQWAGSCWYYLRFIDPKNDKELVGKEVEKYWMPVDWYLGGAEHAVLHLLYARFWHKFLYDLKVISTKEPFQKLSSIGLVLASDGRKMSKRWSNVIRPEDVVKEYGADSLRIYETFMGPFENTIAWNPGSINGVYHFLQRVWALTDKIDSATALEANDLRIMHQTIKRVTEDIEALKLNTPMAALMEWLNHLARKESVSLEEYKNLLILLAPFAPHVTEELWQLVNSSLDDSSKRENEQRWSIHQHSWPEFDSSLLEGEQVEIVIQINGKVRDTLVISKEMVKDSEVVEKMALETSKIKSLITGKTIVKKIYVPGRIINFVL